MPKFLQRWSHEQVETFRENHKALVEKLYPTDEALRKELHRSREKWLRMVEPRTPKETT